MLLHFGALVGGALLAPDSSDIANRKVFALVGGACLATDLSKGRIAPSGTWSKP